MDDDTRSALKDALVREAVALGALSLMLWLLGPGRVLIPAWWAAAKRRMGMDRDPHEAQVRAFAREVSDWDHEQATGPRRRPAPGGDCGCG